MPFISRWNFILPYSLFICENDWCHAQLPWSKIIILYFKFPQSYNLEIQYKYCSRYLWKKFSSTELYLIEKSLRNFFISGELRENVVLCMKFLMRLEEGYEWGRFRPFLLKYHGSNLMRFMLCCIRIGVQMPVLIWVALYLLNKEFNQNHFLLTTQLRHLLQGIQKYGEPLLDLNV